MAAMSKDSDRHKQHRPGFLHSLPPFRPAGRRRWDKVASLCMDENGNSQQDCHQGTGYKGCAVKVLDRCLGNITIENQRNTGRDQGTES